MTSRILIASVVLAAAAPAAAQGPPEAQVSFHAVDERGTVAPYEPQVARAVAAHAFAERVTLGRPYSAEAITEFTQVLGDGNRIERRTVVRVFRDGQGRTRREELGADGTVQSISIYDPVAHVTYVLDPRTRTAHRTQVMIIRPEGSSVRRSGSRTAGPPMEAAIEILPAPAPAGMRTPDREEGPGTFVAAAPAHAGVVVARADAGRLTGAAESLGEQQLGGVRAEGTRSTVTIAAGEIGNEREIRTVSEQWFSPDLQVLVMTRHSDPRSGDTTYRLANIMAGEPDPGLFEVPADYSVKGEGK